MPQLEFSDRLGKMRIQAFAIGLALAWATIGGARAADVLFTITGGGKTASFELPLNPTSVFEVPGAFIFFPSVSVTVGELPATPASVTFWNLGLGGGFVTDGFVFTNTQQFYSGPESSPTFLIGVYHLTNGFGGIRDTVTVVDPPSPAVPELSTWAMLLLGFVGLSYAGYKKAKTRMTLAA
jgi:hypothetical protein